MSRSLIPKIQWTTFIPVLVLLGTTIASSGDRNPQFQHCLKGCSLTQCDPSLPPISTLLRLFGWTCEDDCKYKCAHSFTDHLHSNSQWHQFYGKWPFYRLGPIQEPFSVLMSLGNLYVNLQGINDLKRRVRGENKLRRWLTVAGYAQINTWFWSSVFHTRGRVSSTKSLIKDTPLTERLDYFSATITVSFSLIYALIRVLHLQTPTSTSRLLFPIAASVVFLVSSHFTYLLSFPLGQFPYGYHTKFVVCLGMIHNVLWILWSLSFKLAYPSFTLGNRRIGFPRPYPPLDPLQHRSINAMTPLSLVILTLLAMSFELFDFRPILRVVDAHSMWHAFTIPLAIGWWAFFIQDAIDLESSQLNPRGGTSGGLLNEKTAMSSISSSLGSSADSEQPGRLRTPAMSAFAQAASTPPPPRRSPGARSPVKDRQD